MSASPSAPSFPPLSPARPFPLFSLPNELVQHIIESIIPLDYDVWANFARQAILRSLCLVSKLFREITTPVLLKNVFFHEHALFRKWNESQEEIKQRTNYICFGHNKDGNALTESDVVKMAQNHPSTTSMTMSYRPVNVGILSGLDNLTFLQLHDCTIFGSAVGRPVLKNVATLELFKISFPQPEGIEIFRPESFPALKALAIHKLYTLISADGLPPASLLAPVLLPSVEILVMDDSFGSLKGLNRTDLLTLADKTLYDSSQLPREQQGVRLTSPSVLKYCRVFRRSRYPFDLQRLDDFCSLTTMWIQSSPTPLRLKVLYIREYPPEEYVLCRSAVDSLETVCRNVGIEVVWEEPLDKSNHHSIVSRNFARRMKVRKFVEAEL